MLKYQYSWVWICIGIENLVGVHKYPWYGMVLGPWDHQNQNVCTFIDKRVNYVQQAPGQTSIFPDNMSIDGKLLSTKDYSVVRNCLISYIPEVIVIHT